MRQAIRFSLIMLFAAAAGAAAGAEPARVRWAVIATNSVLDSGLPDLLTVKLTEDESIQLVERERLRDATRELQLGSLMQASKVQQRLQLGRTLGAESLMVLSHEPQDDRQVLRVVVCDAKLGVRLWDGRIVDDGSGAEGLADQCVAVVAEVRQRFAGGVRRIFAVPPFHAENFEQRFDYLQSRQRDVLCGALMARSGVAVVEIEEARAVLRELEDSLAAGIERPIATFVEGSYRVTPPDANYQRHVELQITLVSGEQREQIKKTFLLGTVGHWLTTTLATRLLARGEGHPGSLNTAAQKANLTRHAQRFADLGDWERAISLREAALVLDPNDAWQRGLLVSEYQWMIAAALAANWVPEPYGRKLDPETRMIALQQAADDYVVGLHHLEYLVRNKLITRADAIGLFDTHRWYVRGSVGEAAALFDPLQHEALQPACAAQREFLMHVGDQLDELPTGRKLPERFSTPFYGLQYTLTQHVWSDVRFNGHCAESLESLRNLMERILPDDAKVSSHLVGLMQRHYLAEQRLDRDAWRDEQSRYQETRDALFARLRAAQDVDIRKEISAAIAAIPVPSFASCGPREAQARDEWRAYLRRLTHSDRAAVKLYGHWGLLRETGQNVRNNATIQTLVAELKHRGQISPPTLAHFETSHTAVARGTNERRPRLAPAPARDRVQLQTIRLAIEGDDGSPVIKGMLQCGESCDAYWTKDRFFVMHEPGVLHELKLTAAQADQALFWEAAWDGECIWLHAHGEGIVAIRPDGTRLATFKQPDIPGYWKGHKLLGLSPRRALMVGSFGETDRAWGAILEIDDAGKPRVNLFFQAKYVSAGRSQEEARANVLTAFRPHDIFQVRCADGKQYAIVGRSDLSSLRIDLDTLKVAAVASLRDGRASTRTDLGFAGDVFLYEGRVISPLSGFANLQTSHTMVYWDGWLYRPGYVWMREHLATGQQQRLHREKLPADQWNLRLAVSAHYGLVAYDPSDHQSVMYRVDILDDAYVDNMREVP